MSKPIAQPIVQSIRCQNILSFGEAAAFLELRPLNVLIGPNGSGKSNLLEALGLLAGAPRNLAEAILDGGGIRDWLWKGEQHATPTATLEAVLSYPNGTMPLRYRLSFTELGQRLHLTDERIENERAAKGETKPYFFFGIENGRPMFNVLGKRRELQREDLSPEQSVLSQRKDPDHYPEITYVGDALGSFRLYREWTFGRQTAARTPQKADLPNDFLEPDGRNLGLVLNSLRKTPGAKHSFLHHLRDFYANANDIDVSVQGGTVQVFLEEILPNRPAAELGKLGAGSFVLPATRLSDGTLRWISLLAILLHPRPPRLVCIEEPELGLHPDILPRLAILLREASERMQLVITTHSDILVDALTDVPESVVVCEKPLNHTVFSRLDSAYLKKWLAKYTLGELWRKGELGGTRY